MNQLQNYSEGYYGRYYGRSAVGALGPVGVPGAVSDVELQAAKSEVSVSMKLKFES